MWLYRWPDGKAVLCEKPADVAELGDDEDYRDSPPPADVRKKARDLAEAAAQPAPTPSISAPTDGELETVALPADFPGATSIHGMPGREVNKYVDSMTTVPAVFEIAIRESSHPEHTGGKFGGGRASVLDACGARAIRIVLGRLDV